MKAHIIRMAYPRQPDLPNKRTIWNGYIVSDMIEVGPVTADRPLRRRASWTTGVNTNHPSSRRRTRYISRPRRRSRCAPARQQSQRLGRHGARQVVRLEPQGPRLLDGTPPTKERAPASESQPQARGAGEAEAPAQGGSLPDRRAGSAVQGGHSFCREDVIGNEC
jgi:hypothetical protein